MKLDHGVLTISLDFELYWGVRDKRTLDEYRDNLLGSRKIIPQLLRIFSANDAHVSWATVGFLFFETAEDLRQHYPKRLPTYKQQRFSPYQYITQAETIEPSVHFAPDLIAQIKQHAGQEIATHTLSHYYCLEEGQTVDQFEADIEAAVDTAKKNGISIRSLVFPRNQWNTAYLASLPKYGVKCFRGNQSSWMYKASDEGGQQPLQRVCRLLDAYINLSGHNTYTLTDCAKEEPFNFPASRFLRPYSSTWSLLEPLRLRRIKHSMEYAAKHKQIFHLWWHPHNFGVNIPQNIHFLNQIIKHFCYLRSEYGMTSLNMGELCQLAESGHGNK